MATHDEETFDALMALVGEDLPPATWSGFGDLGRMSFEAMISQREDPREAISSHGRLRLFGAGVAGHSADLDDVGRVATLWQRCVSAVGASLEGSRSQVGRIPDMVSARTRLQLSAAPAPGSIVLNVAPKAAALDEVSPAGVRQIFDVPRPLADRASDELIDLLSSASSAGPNADDLSIKLRELGPRVATSIRALAEVLERAHFDIDVSWTEPELPTRRATVPAGTSGWLREFVTGRALDATEETVAGDVRTVSDVAKWQISTPEGLVSIDASSLDSQLVRSVRVGQAVRILVRVRIIERPDGNSTTTREAISLLDDTLGTNGI